MVSTALDALCHAKYPSPKCAKISFDRTIFPGIIARFPSGTCARSVQSVFPATTYSAEFATLRHNARTITWWFSFLGSSAITSATCPTSSSSRCSNAICSCARSMRWWRSGHVSDQTDVEIWKQSNTYSAHTSWSSRGLDVSPILDQHFGCRLRVVTEL